jgi:RHS repeat-associated protein
VTNAQGKVWSSEFDAHGHRTASLDPNSHTTQYAYDATGQLTAITNVLGQVQQYQYDPVNRMTNKTYLEAGDVTRFYYDDQWRLIAEYDGSGNLLAKYVYGPEIDEPVRMTRGGNAYYYHAAAPGTVAEITDASGNVVERYTYDVYGEPTIFDFQSSILSASAIGNRLLFQGRDRDPATGLYNFRNRYYSPGLGRFVQTDRIRHIGGPNLYGFVGNNPINRLDFLGLKAEVPGGPASHCQDPCGDAKKKGLDKGDAGGVICCAGKKYSCVWKPGGSTGAQNATSVAIISQCLAEHENAHHDDIECPKTWCYGFPTRPPFRDPSQANAEECNSYFVQLDCLRRNMSNCGADQQCQEEVQHELDFVANELNRRGCSR